MIRVFQTFLPGVLRIIRYTSSDHRGIYAEIYNRRDYLSAGIDIDFVEDDFSFSPKNVLRGLHGDSKTWKLVSCPFGRLYLVVLNCDPESNFSGRWISFELTPDNALQILIPPKYANGHLVLSEWAMFHYKQSEYYQSAQNQFVVRWDDPKFNIFWPITEKPILSIRDGG